MGRLVSFSLLAVAFITASGCQNVDLTAINHATTNKLNVHVTDPGETKVYGSLTAIQPGQSKSKNVISQAGPVIEEVRIIAILSTPGGQEVTRESQVLEIGPMTTTLTVDATDDDSISVTTDPPQ